MPEVCQGRAYTVLSKSGAVLREVGPPLSAEQKAAQIEEARRKKELEEQARERRRRDQALLDTYSSMKDIDLAQEKAEAEVKLSIASVEAQIQGIRQKRKKFEDEAEFYKKKHLPPDIEKGLQNTAHEIKLQEELRDLKKNDFASIKAKYDGDRQRYLALQGQRPAATTAHPSGGAEPRPR